MFVNSQPKSRFWSNRKANSMSLYWVQVHCNIHNYPPNNIRIQLKLIFLLAIMRALLLV